MVSDHEIQQSTVDYVFRNSRKKYRKLPSIENDNSWDSIEIRQHKKRSNSHGKGIVQQFWDRSASVQYFYQQRIVFSSAAKLFPPGLEPGTFRVLGERDNHYTTETLSTVAS